MTPREHAQAFIIHRYADPLAWDVTIGDIEQSTGIDRRRVGYILSIKGWRNRVRSTQKEFVGMNSQGDWE